jgi:hypothetical protein
LSLHRLSDRNRLGVSCFDPDVGRNFQDDGAADRLSENHGGQRHPRVQAFCPTCGSPIYSTSPGEHPRPSYTLRVGILRQREQLVPKRQIWFRSALPWVTGLGTIPDSKLATVPASTKQM